MKRTYLKIHTYLALLSAVPFLVVCITGSILVFKPELDGLLHPNEYFIEDIYGLERLPIDNLVDVIAAAQPNYVVGSWEVFDGGHIADRVYLIQKGTDSWFKVHLDPYRGVLLSVPKGVTYYFTDWMVSLHYTFLLGVTGTFLGAFFAIFMCVIGVTGLIMQRKFWRALFIRRNKKRIQVLLVNWHTFVGVVSAPTLLILGITGGYWNIAAALHELEHHVIEAPYYIQASLYEPSISIQTLYEDSQLQIPEFTPTYLLFPYEPDLPFTVFGRVKTANSLLSDYASTVSYDPQSGSKKAIVDIRESEVGVKLLDSFRHLHFGLFGGLPIRILWSVLGFMPVVLMATGIYVWYSRMIKRRQAKVKRNNLGVGL